jgi:hypothetical protein
LKRTFHIILFSFFYSTLYCQTGGDNVYEFLNLTHSGLVASIGGSNVSLTGRNLNLAWHNPALLSSGMDKSLALNYVNYLAGINYGLAMYSFSIPEKGNFAGGITYLNYGAFTEADASGNITGSFSASEYAFSAIWSLELDSAFAVGVNFKPVLSHLEKYTSLGFAFDLGASWHNRANLISAGIVFRNIGWQVTTYAGEQRGKLPFEILTGASVKLAHAPFRFSLTVRHLEKYDLTYNYPESSGVETSTSGSGFFENIMRHAIFGAEIIPHRNFYLGIGYNYQRRRELQTEGKVAGVGLSWGFGFNTSFLSLEYGRSSYHLAGSSNNVSLILKPDLVIKKLRK